jgi:hypothetical protein
MLLQEVGVTYITSTNTNSRLKRRGECRGSALTRAAERRVQAMWGLSCVGLLLTRLRWHMMMGLTVGIGER